jgi:superfamily II DNA or RNA helicase
VVDLAMIQSLQSDAAGDVFGDYGQIVVDECHHIPAVSFDGIIRKAAARFVLGLTATPYFQVDAEVEPLERERVIRETALDPKLGDDAPIQEVDRALVEDEERNRWICDDIREAVAEGRNCIVLTEWREHLDRLATILETSGVRAITLHGGVKKKERLARVAELNAASPEEPVLVLATGALVGEGFDLPRLDTLVLTFPISFRGKVIQYAGRILRSHPAKTTVTVYDYRDVLVPVLARMQTRRQKALEGVGFTNTKVHTGLTDGDAAH